MTAKETFSVKTPLFEGPFDLLLFFIKRDELNIHDIPIAKITDDFLAYIAHLEKLNIEIASEFMLVAATLMQIKAKMLLPRLPKDEKGEEIDPRAELVKHLLEYKKYKEVVAQFEQWEIAMADREKRGNILQEIKQIALQHHDDVELLDLDLFKLLRIYQQVMARYENAQNRPIHQIKPYAYTVEEQKNYLLSLLHHKKRLSFTEIIQESHSKILIIFNFLAILELLALRLVDIQLGMG
ncbi:MAG: segregation/condensation protein A, partial [Flammeovirgaceae bacterium]|nr:segregation/condensation protein A [Flammeovirgaceae bacterium]MDW8288849.1 segregation/condensation protein A [Flammeovirgaceae bacterium]